MVKEEIHNIFWAGKNNLTGKDINTKIIVIDCYVKSVDVKILTWTVNEAWARIYSWLESRGCKINQIQ